METKEEHALETIWRMQFYMDFCIVIMRILNHYNRLGKRQVN